MKKWKKNLAIFGSAAVLLVASPIVLIAVSGPDIPSSVVVKNDYVPTYGERSLTRVLPFGSTKEDVLNFVNETFFKTQIVSGVSFLEDLCVLMSTFMNKGNISEQKWCDYRTTMLGRTIKISERLDKYIDIQYKNQLDGEISITNIGIDWENFKISFDINGVLTGSPIWSEEISPANAAVYIEKYEIHGSVKDADIILDCPDATPGSTIKTFWGIQPNENSHIEATYNTINVSDPDSPIRTTEKAPLLSSADPEVPEAVAKLFWVKPSYTLKGINVKIPKES